MTEIVEADPNDVAAHAAVSAFLEAAREVLDDKALAIALVGAGGGLYAALEGR